MSQQQDQQPDEPDEEQDGTTPQGGAGEAAEQFQEEPAESEVEEIEAEREERLSPDSRPDGAEIDNTQREFDVQKGMFTDAEGYEQAEERFPPAEEQAT